MILTLLVIALLALGVFATWRLFAVLEAADHRCAEQALDEIERTLCGLADGSVDFAIFAVGKEGRVRSLPVGFETAPGNGAEDVRSLVVVRRVSAVSQELPAFVAETIHAN